MEKENHKTLVYDSIKAQCKDLNISLSELCRHSDVNRNLLHNWSLKNPKTIDILNSLNEGLDNIRTEKGLNK